jgi:alpha-2-macroglobulin
VRDANEIRIRSNAPLYFAAEGRFVSLEEPVKAAGNEIFVRREYARLAARPTLLKGTLYDRVDLADQGSMNSGERVEVVMTIEAKNDYEYLMFEDLKPAGLEAIALQSGNLVVATDTKSGRTVQVYQELRDRKVVSFIDHLPQGIWQIRYTLRGEVPGSFHALPVLGQAMYVPEIKANSEEVRMEVR